MSTPASDTTTDRISEDRQAFERALSFSREVRSAPSAEAAALRVKQLFFALQMSRDAIKRYIDGDEEIRKTINEDVSEIRESFKTLSESYKELLAENILLKVRAGHASRIMDRAMRSADDASRVTKEYCKTILREMELEPSDPIFPPDSVIPANAAPTPPAESDELPEGVTAQGVVDDLIEGALRLRGAKNYVVIRSCDHLTQAQFDRLTREMAAIQEQQSATTPIKEGAIDTLTGGAKR